MTETTTDPATDTTTGSGTPAGTTPSQTVGPFLSIGLTWVDGPNVVAEGTPGAVVVSGTMTDGAGDPVPDGLVEIWQADPNGHFAHPDDPNGAPYPGFRGFARASTDAEGRYWFRTLKPGPVEAEDGLRQAPHLDVIVFARGLLKHLVTRIYFPDETAANAEDPVLLSLEPAERTALTAVTDGAAGLRFDICLQGEGETPFFDL